MRELESHLGFRLFNRTTRHVSLTVHGSELLGVVRRSLDQLDDTISRIGKVSTEASMSLSVGAPPLIAANVLPEAIKEFRSSARHPNSGVRCRGRRSHPDGRDRQA
jgi:DNA-binding transcriptional LysR family regulator